MGPRRPGYEPQWLWDQPPRVAARYVLDRVADPETGHRRTVPRERLLDPDVKVRLWRRMVRSEHVHRFVAALDGLNMLTTKQATAWVGWAQSKASDWTKPAFEFGLARRGRYQPDEVAVGKLNWLWALNSTGRNAEPPLRRWIDEITADDATAVFGPPRARRNRRTGEMVTARRPSPHATGGSLHMRHDVLTAELVLRLLETGNGRWTAVWPAWAATPRAVSGDPDAPAHFNGDAVLWRDDGLRVVLETAASNNQAHIAHKIEQWAGWFAGRPFADNGIVLVVVNAQHDRHAVTAGTLRNLHASILTTGTLRHLNGSPATSNEVRRARTQLHLAAWEDWFPAPHRIALAGADVATTFTPDGERWLTTRAAVADDLVWAASATARRTGPPAPMFQPVWIGDPALTVPDVARSGAA